ncbi:MAG: HAD family hydrolase [Gammaproteobacteria bacterium]|nr:MAG: HAD family hydrolase [Gammaproteobacteria bacterium]
MIKAVLFDFSSTLIDSPAWMALEIRTLPRDAFELLVADGHIAPLGAEELGQAESIFHQARELANATERETSHADNLSSMVAALGLQDQVSQVLVEQTVATLHRRCLPKVTLVTGAAETLTALQAHDYRISIISNAAYSPFLTWTLERFELLHLFEKIVVSADVGVRKPGLDIFRMTLDQLELEPADVVYVGDDFQKDVAAPKQLGMRAIWFRPDGAAPPPEGQAAADAAVSELVQIPDRVDRWSNSRS